MQEARRQSARGDAFIKADVFEVVVDHRLFIIN